MNPEEDNNELTLLMVGTSVGLSVLASIGVIAARVWSDAVSWMLRHDLLVAAPEQPWVAVPGADGAGLDLARVLILAAAAVALIACAVQGMRAMWSRRGELR